MGKLSQGSTEKQGLEDELITKQRESKGVGSSSIIKAKLPKLVITKFSGAHIDCIRVSFDGEWQQWDFPKLIDALRQQVEGNPTRRDKNFKTRQQNATNRKCVFCDSIGHRINDCTEVKGPVKRRQSSKT